MVLILSPIVLSSVSGWSRLRILAQPALHDPIRPAGPRIPTVFSPTEKPGLRFRTPRPIWGLHNLPSQGSATLWRRSRRVRQVLPSTTWRMVSGAPSAHQGGCPFGRRANRVSPRLGGACFRLPTGFIGNFSQNFSPQEKFFLQPGMRRSLWLERCNRLHRVLV